MMLFIAFIVWAVTSSADKDPKTAGAGTTAQTSSVSTKRRVEQHGTKSKHRKQQRGSSGGDRCVQSTPNMVEAPEPASAR
jgi:hypothetical protein